MKRNVVFRSVGKKKQIQSWCCRIVNVTACILRIGLGEVWVFENRQPVTEAKLINKS
jgi:hypothetical protein